jgi:hypothetical protein
LRKFIALGIIVAFISFAIGWLIYLVLLILLTDATFFTWIVGGIIVVALFVWALTVMDE